MYIFPSKYHVIVIGAGHAGCEASLAASRMGCNVLLLTGNLDTIAQMSCNPAIGGLAKGHLVREIDALGGEMARNIDATGIQFRILNKKKGPAVWGYRAQADKKAYQARMKHVLEGQNGLDLKQEMAIEIILESGSARGVICRTGNAYHADCVIVTSGTFLNGVIHIGEMSFGGGRSGEQASVELASNLRKIGLETGRLKTGTPPRINVRNIDTIVMVRQDGDPQPAAFSFSTGKVEIEQLPCFITHTTESTKRIILENLKRSPLYSGKITATGVRYCPSIEDKMVKFPDKVGHQVFIEPEGRDTNEVYLNGASTSLPCDVQLAVVRSIVGLEKAEILRHGYAIEYDYVLPTQLYGTLETKNIRNLYLAGQINGSSGYEEAAAQGLMAGINAALRAKGKEPVVLDRSQAYIGVLIDDLVTKGTMEPYRMFTSRAEYRLFLRQDNADIRLMDPGRRIGLVSEAQACKLERKKAQIEDGLKKARELRCGDETLEQMLKKQGNTIQKLKSMFGFDIPEYDEEVIQQIEIQIRYDGYLKRQVEDIQKFRKMEGRRIPASADYSKMVGLKKEAVEKLQKVRPGSIGQAARISGISPSDVSVLMIWIEKEAREQAVV